MKILIIHEIEWFKKVIFEPHHISELFSLNGHDVFVIDCAIPDFKNLIKGLKTRILKNSSRVYDGANVTVIRPPTLLVRGLNRIFHFLTCEKVIRNTIKKNNIEIILLYGVATNGKQTIKVAKEFDIPIIFRALDVAHGLIRIPLLKQITKNFEKFVIRNSTKILTTTNDLARYAHEMGGKNENIEMFPLGINARVFKPLKKDLTLCTQLGISEDDTVIVFMGTLYEFSGVENIIRNFQFIKKKNLNTKFLIVGGGQSFNKIKNIIHNNDLDSDIVVTGFIPQQEVPRYIALADICINPFEVNYVTDRILPTKILEYFACGKPVLSTPLNGTKELLPDESFGILYSTSKDFTKILSTLLSDKDRLKQLGKQAYEYVQRNHNWDILSEQLIEKFELLVKK